MSKALVKSRGGRRDNVAGVIPAACSAVIPGLGQLINGETDKAIGVFAVAAVAGLSFLHVIPVLGAAAALIGGATWVYGVADGFLEGRKR